jgi:hypothetical protein
VKTRTRVALLGAVALTIATGCEAVVVDRINQTRTAAGVAALPTTAYLNDAAGQHSVDMCAARQVTATPNPTAAYGLETTTGVVEVVDAEPLDPAIADPAARNADATDAMWARWEDNAGIVDPGWSALGVGEHECEDGRLYMTAVLRRPPTMPASGRFSTTVYTDAQIQAVTGLRYGTALNSQGQTVDLLLDLHLPPDDVAAARPVAVGIHGGGFTGGSRTQMTSLARAYAQRGYVGATISYRLRPDATTLPEIMAAATDGIDDGMEAVRWLKANAATYHLDAGRIALLGSSAGGVVAMGAAVAEDQTPGGPLASVDPQPAAAVSTGVSLTAGLDQIVMDPADAPFLQFSYEQDTAVLREPWYVAYQGCQAAHAGGTICDFVKLPGSGHTISLAPSGTRWTGTIGPFLWHHLDL